MSSDTLSFNQLIKADPEYAYRSFTNATLLRGWLCNFATAVPHAGGRLYMWWESGYYTSGEYTQVDPGKALSFTWFGKGEPAASRVEVTFSPHNGGTLIKLEHKGLGSDPEWETARKEAEKGWFNALGNLSSVVETGEDQRFVSRPMLGILLDELNEQIAEELGLDSSDGIRLGGTVPGMGAEAAGLRENDVMISMGGMQTTDYDHLNQALNAHKAGDAIEVVFFRDGKQEKVNMTLSGRPIPVIPPTAKELAQEVAKIYRGMEKELIEFLNEVSEEEASSKPGETEWSIKYVLAHFIQGERYSQRYIDELVGGFESFTDDYGGNIDEMIEATVATYPTARDLLNEFKLTMSETINYLANLPDDFVAQKGEYWRLAYGFLQDPYHFNSHLEQMKATLKAARDK